MVRIKSRVQRKSRDGASAGTGKTRNQNQATHLSSFTQIQAQNAAQTNLAQQHLTQLSQTLQNQACVTSPLVNGTVGSRISLVQQNQSIQNTSNVPILVKCHYVVRCSRWLFVLQQSHLQGTTQIKTTSQVSNQELEINALATKLMNMGQQFQAAGVYNSTIKNIGFMRCSLRGVEEKCEKWWEIKRNIMEVVKKFV